MKRKSVRSVPRIQRLHRKVYLSASFPGALNMVEVSNECGSVCCRAGWVNKVTFGAPRVLLPRTYSSMGTATRVYAAHGYDVDREYGAFDAYTSPERALEKMRALAMLECAGYGIAQL